MRDLLEKYKVYSAVLKAMKEEEKYNQRKSVLSANEVLDLSFKRYEDMLMVLEPLKESLGKDINITNIYFAKGYQDDTGIMIEYQDEEGKKFFSILEYYEKYYDILYHDNNVYYQNIKKENERIIQDAFKLNAKYEFEHETIIPSTSGMFNVKEGCNYFGLNDKLDSLLKMNYQFEEREGSKLIVPTSISSSMPKINDVLKNNTNVRNILDNIKIYEENVPKHLIKNR